MTEATVRQQLAARIKRHGQAATARQLGVSTSELHRVYHGAPLRPKLLAGMGLRRVVRVTYTAEFP